MGKTNPEQKQSRLDLFLISQDVVQRNKTRKEIFESNALVKEELYIYTIV